MRERSVGCARLPGWEEGQEGAGHGALVHRGGCCAFGEEKLLTPGVGPALCQPGRTLCSSRSNAVTVLTPLPPGRTSLQLSCLWARACALTPRGGRDGAGGREGSQSPLLFLSPPHSSSGPTQRPGAHAQVKASPALDWKPQEESALEGEA